MSALKEHRKAAVILFISLFLVMVGFGIIIPILPFYVLHYQGNALTLGLLMSTYSVMQFIFAPVWGKLSDRIGRRPILLIGLGGYGISFIIFGLANHLWMLFAARIISGILSSATLPTAMAYIADITTPEDRSKGIGLMGAAMGAGIIVGPGLGGIVGHYSLAMPFFVAGGLAFLTLPWAYFLLPESKSSHDRSAPGDNQGLSLAMLRHPQFPLFAATLVVSFTMAMFEGTFALFAADRVGFGPRDMGVLFTIIGVLGVVVQSCLLWRIINLFGDAAVITGSLLISAVGLFCMMQSTSVSSLWIYTAIFSVGNTCLRPSLSTLISKTSSTGQGASMGVMQSFDSLGRIAGPVFGGWTYGLSRNSPFFIAACMLVSTLLFLRARLILYEKMANSEAQSSQSIQEA